MRWLDAIRTRLGLLSSRAAAEARADQEFRLHVEMETEALIRTGLTPDEARRRALVGFGGLERHKEEMRDERGARWLEDLASDLRYAGRSLRQSPGFAAVAILTLALGIGANTAIFSVMNAVLFRPLPVEGLERLVVVREDLPQMALRNTPLAPAEVLDLGARADLFERVGSFRAGGMTLTGDGDPVRVSTATTLGDFFGVFGLRPEVGRFYDPRTATQGPHGVAVISYGLWQRLAGGDPEIVGRTIRLDDSPYEIVGVLPRDFAYPRRVEILMPFAFAERWVNNRGSLFMTTIARPQAALSNEQVAAGLAGEVKRWNDRYHAGSQFGKTLGATPFIEYLAGPLRPVLLVLMGAVVFVMLIATANVASLQLVRANGRAREMTVRAAMGAGRSRLMRQLAVESLVLAAAGAVAGLTLGGLALQLLGQWPASSQMLPADVTLDRTVLAFTAAVSLIAAILFGVVPTVRASRVEPQEVLRERSRGASEGPGRLRLLRSGLVVQVALAIVLLIASGLMVRTLSSLLGTNLGFDATNVTTVKISVTRSTYESVEQRHAFFTTLLERVRGMSGVESAALMWGVPFSDETDSSPFAIEGLPAVEVGPERHAEARFVSPGLFRTLRIPLRAGRDFEATDRPGAPRVVIIDATFAEQFFPGVSPIGKRIAHYVGGEPSTIVGVVERIDHNEIADEPKATAYYSTMQHRISAAGH